MDELEQRVHNAVSDDSADHGSDEFEEELDHEEIDTSDSGEQDLDSDQDDSSDTGDDDTDTDADASAGGDAADDIEEDADDDEYLDYQRPQITGVPEVEPFDITKLNLPRDENGKIRPEDLNKAVQDYHQRVAEANSARAEAEGKVVQQLTTQWTKVKDKFPHIAKSPELRNIARDMHFASMKEGEAYLSPLAAAKKVDKMYKRIVKKGVVQQKTKRRVEQTGSVKTSSGRTTSQSSKLSSYQKARALSMSSDPLKAAQGRRAVIRMRREARNAK